MTNSRGLVVRNLTAHLFTKRGCARAVDGISFAIPPGKTLGLVGESGSGKSMACMALMRLLPKPAGQIVDGEVWLDGVDLLKLSEREMQEIRGRSIAMILQDPTSSLNPVLKIGYQVGEPVRQHENVRGGPLRTRVVELMRHVQIAAPEDRINAYPHQLSGGMRQRVVGAAALACKPQLLIADEPTTSLDVTVQMHYLSLLQELQQQQQFGMLFITHDIHLVPSICDSVAVMYAGRIVEQGEVDAVFKRPAHPYTRALLRAAPRLDEAMESLESIPGELPSLTELGPGCRFAARCSKASQVCSDAYPPDTRLQHDHRVNCWLYGQPA